MKVSGIAVSAAMLVYAGVSVYRQGVLTFTDMQHALTTARDWILRRDRVDGWVQDELVGMREERKRFLRQQQRMERSLRACLDRRPSGPRPKSEWPFGTL